MSISTIGGWFLLVWIASFIVVLIFLGMRMDYLGENAMSAGKACLCCVLPGLNTILACVIIVMGVFMFIGSFVFMIMDNWKDFWNSVGTVFFFKDDDED